MPWLTRAGFVALLVLAGAADASAQDVGAALYVRQCAHCHGDDGLGGELGPAIVRRLELRTDEQLAALVRDGLPDAGMPGVSPSVLSDDEIALLVGFARTLDRGATATLPEVTVETSDGSTLHGRRLGRGPNELQVLARNPVGENEIRLLRRTANDWFRPVTSDADWPTYHGTPGANRYSPLAEIDPSTVSRLAPSWVFPVPRARRLQVTPVVVDGVMYVTNANECYALDAGSGRQLWHYRRPRTEGLVGDASAGINRGVAVAGRRVFMITDHAHLIALDRFTGALLWDTEMADWRENYGATSAPLIAGDLVVSGTAGGDEGVRGFLAAFDQATGEEVWRFWTVPRPGEPGSETWVGTAIEHPCASTWLTGSFDPELGLLYWPTGNPCPDFDGAERQGDNLYSDSILALEATTGELRWYFQYTPHDLWDWDAQQPPVLVDREWNGEPRKLLLHANRNGFFYVLDRTDGELLLAEPFVEKLTWASRIDERGRPVRRPNQAPSLEGTRVCPAVHGATNWFSTSFHPGTGLYYVQTLEQCQIYTRRPEEWEAGRSFYGGSTRNVQDEEPRKILRAIDIRTGEIAWAHEQVGPGNSWGGTLSTAGGLVFAGEDGGAMIALDAVTGEVLWRFPANVLWKASPMTYRFDGRQHVAVAAGATIVSFALVGPGP